MAERYATKTGNWSDVSVWDGGLSLPGVGDDVYANGYTVTINDDYTCLCLHTDAGNTAAAGGKFQTSGAVTITADSQAGASRCLEVNADGVQVGDSTGGKANNTYGTYCSYGGIQNGNSTSGSGSGAYGTYCVYGGIQNGNSTGGSVSGARGTYCQYGGIHNGDSTGGSASNAYGTYCQNGGIHNGDSTGGSVSGAHGTYCTYGGIHNGDSTGGSVSDAYGTYCHNGGIHNGDSTGGSVSGAHGTYCQNGGKIICPLATGTVNGAYGVVTVANTGAMAYILAESGDYPKSIGANTDTTLDNIQFGWAFVPASNKVKLGTSFNNATQSGAYYPPNLDTDPGVEDAAAVLTTAHYGEDNAIQGTGEGGGGYTYGDEDAAKVLTTAAGAGTYQPVDPADVRAGTDVGVSPAVGTLAVPAAADVRYGEDVDDTTGTCYVPAAADVQFGVNVDATTGTFTSPAVGKVIDDTSWGAGGVEFTGTYHAPEAAEVISTAVFGPASGTAGTYDVSNVSAGNIKDGVSIGGVEGTYDPMAAAVFPAEANVEVAETAYGPTGAEYAGALDLAAAEAAAASAQHATDAAFLETNKDEIIPNGTDILGEFGVTGTAVVGGGPLVGPSALVSC